MSLIEFQNGCEARVGVDGRFLMLLGGCVGLFKIEIICPGTCWIREIRLKDE